MTQSHSSTDNKYPIKQLIIKRPSNSGFGFCIRGGAEHGVGLYVSSVDARSVAENEGLSPGDHIVQVNGTKFDGLTHAQAVKVTITLFLILTMFSSHVNYFGEFHSLLNFFCELTCTRATIRIRVKCTW